MAYRVAKDESGHFVPIGNKGWCLRYGERARFDQQPVEAQAMTDACITAFEMIGDPCWIDHARCSFEWFLGRNDLGLPLYNDVTGGCRDGLQPRGVNQNQGGGIDLILADIAFQDALPERAPRFLNALRQWRIFGILSFLTPQLLFKMMRQSATVAPSPFE